MRPPARPTTPFGTKLSECCKARAEEGTATITSRLRPAFASLLLLTSRSHAPAGPLLIETPRPFVRPSHLLSISTLTSHSTFLPPLLRSRLATNGWVKNSLTRDPVAEAFCFFPCCCLFVGHVAVLCGVLLCCGRCVCVLRVSTVAPCSLCIGRCVAVDNGDGPLPPSRADGTERRRAISPSDPASTASLHSLPPAHRSGLGWLHTPHRDGVRRLDAARCCAHSKSNVSALSHPSRCGRCHSASPRRRATLALHIAPAATAIAHLQDCSRHHHSSLHAPTIQRHCHRHAHRRGAGRR